MRDLGTLGGTLSTAAAISASGEVVVVGRSETASGVKHAFRWTDARGMEDLGARDEGESDARDVNASGAAVGYIPADECSEGQRQAVLWPRDGEPVPLA